MELIINLKSFHCALVNIFKDRSGYDAVKRGHYRLQDARKPGKWAEIEVDISFEQAFVPGGFIDMTMMLPSEIYVNVECPICGWPEQLTAELSRMQWYV